MLSDLLRNGLWVPLFSDQDRCLTGGVLRGCKCGPGSCGLMVQSSGTNNRRATRRKERKAACMVNGVALISPGVALISPRGSRNVPTVAVQLLQGEKVQRLYLNWGSVNWLTHGLI